MQTERRGASRRCEGSFPCVLTSCWPWTPQAAYCRTEFTTSGGSSSQTSLEAKGGRAQTFTHHSGKFAQSFCDDHQPKSNISQVSILLS